MKRCCKNVDITDIAFIRDCIYRCLDGKWERTDVHKTLAEFSDLTRSEIRNICRAKNYRHKTARGYAIDYQRRKRMIINRLDTTIQTMASQISHDIKTRTVQLPPIQYKTIIDNNSGKQREIGRESIIHQIYDYVGVHGAMELFDRKIGTYQCASISDRGQVYGKTAIEKWLRTSPKTTKYAVKADVEKCYPNIDHERLIYLLRRDIKNEQLLWLIEFLINQFDRGLSIGSYLSQYLCNYYLSYAYHYVAEQLAITKTRRGKSKRVRLVNHVIFYMDDILLLGGNKRHLRQGFEMLKQYMADFLKLQLKDNWRLFRVQYYDRDGRAHGDIIDMMGYRIGRKYTTIRKRIFKRLRHNVIMAERHIKRNSAVPRHIRDGICGQYGWLVHSDSYGFVCNHGLIFDKQQYKNKKKKWGEKAC